MQFNLIQNSDSLYKSRLLTLIFILFSPLSFSQSNLKDSLNEIATNSGYSEVKTARFFEKKASEYFIKKEYIKARICDKRALELYSKNKMNLALGKVYTHLADIHYEISDFPTSLKYYLKALEKYEKEQKKPLIYKTKRLIGDLYLRLEQCESAFNQLEEAKKYYKANQSKYRKEYLTTLKSIGISFGRCGSIDSALYYFEFALSQVEKPYSGIFTGGLLNNIGAIYSKKDKLDKALSYYNEALELFTNDDIQEGIGVSISNIAYLRKKQSRYNESIELLLKALNIFEENKSLIYLRDNYLNISEVYELNNQPLEALKYIKLYLNLNDSITNSDVIANMGNLQIQFEIKKKDQELLIKKQELQISENENKLYQTRLLYLFVGGAIFLVIILLLALRNQKISIRNSQLKEAILQKEKEELKHEVAMKNNDLESFALRIAEKNDTLKKLKDELEGISAKSEENSTRIKEITSTINNELYIDQDRKEFEFQLDKAYQSFFIKLDQKFPKLTKNERRLCSLLALDLSTKEIATVLNISIEGVKKSRYRLRKKLDLESENDLSEFIKNI